MKKVLTKKDHTLHSTNPITQKNIGKQGLDKVILNYEATI
jgi:hypothetical protein